MVKKAIRPGSSAAETKPEFKTAYGERTRVGFETIGESMTQQHFAEETEINNIISFHDRTGLIKCVQQGVAKYGDFSEINEYKENLDMIKAADAAFNELPSNVRKRFSNNAGEFFEFATNPGNLDELVEMGLAEASPRAGDTSASPAAVEAPILNESE